MRRKSAEPSSGLPGTSQKQAASGSMRSRLLKLIPKVAK